MLLRIFDSLRQAAIDLADEAMTLVGNLVYTWGCLPSRALVHHHHHIGARTFISYRLSNRARCDIFKSDNREKV